MTQTHLKTTTAVAVIAAATVATTAFGGNTAPATPVAAPDRIFAFPSVFGVATAVPPADGTRYVALTYATPRGGIAGGSADGELAFGYTLGSPVRNVSATIGANITSLTDDFGDSGNFNLSLSRMVATGSRSATFVGLSVGKLGGWGDAAAENEAYSVQVSHLVGVGASDTPVQLTLGYGNQTTLSDDGLGTLDDGFFYGVGVGVTEALSLSLSGTETQFNLGATANIAAFDGLSVTAGVYDVTENVSRRQVSLTVGYSF